MKKNHKLPLSMVLSGGVLLQTASHLILIVLMFFGRVGGLTLIFATLSNTQHSSARLPQEIGRAHV